MPFAAADLSDFPEPFVVNHYTAGFADVMGADYVGKHSVVAAEIIYSLRPVEGNFITRLDTEILTTYQNYDLLLIGDPCQNQITAKVLGTNECGMGLKPGEAIIKLVDNGGKKALIVAGHDFDSLRRAGLILAHYQDYDFIGNEYKIEAEQDSGIETVEPAPSIPIVTNYVGKCDGCLVAQSCLKKGEIIFGTYCDGSQMQEFKPKGESCNENYECISNYCNGKCSNKSLWQSFLSWIKNIFK